MALATRVLSPLPTEDETVNRWQRHVCDTLNPVLRQIGAMQPVSVTGSRAAADPVTLSLLAALVRLGLVKDETT